MILLDDQYWSERYVNKETGWDIGSISTPLKEYIEQLRSKGIAILIPGGGNSYEAAYLLALGFTDVTVADISTVVCTGLNQRHAMYLGNGLTILHSDFFQLEGQYDLILEQTFFCALEPSLRKAYAAKMYELLKPGGKLVGVLFNRSFESGPPFSGSKEEYIELFSGDFTIETMDDCYNSIIPRKGAELFVKLKKEVELPVG